MTGLEEQVVKDIDIPAHIRDAAAEEVLEALRAAHDSGVSPEAAARLAAEVAIKTAVPLIERRFIAEIDRYRDGLRAIVRQVKQMHYGTVQSVALHHLEQDHIADLRPVDEEIEGG